MFLEVVNEMILDSIFSHIVEFVFNESILVIKNLSVHARHIP